MKESEMSSLYEWQDQIELMRAIVKAVDEGKEIQYKDSEGNWVPKVSGRFRFSFHKYNYRVKPEQLVRWLNFYDHGSHAYGSKEEAKKNTVGDCIRVAVKMVEAADEVEDNEN